PELWVYSAAFFEALAAVGLVLGIYTRWTALLGAFVLFVAAAALFKVGGFKWLWNLGGFEYPVFWALACVAVALNAWKEARAAATRPARAALSPAEGGSSGTRSLVPATGVLCAAVMAAATHEARWFGHRYGINL